MLCAGGAGGHCRQFAASKLPRSRSPPVRRPTAPGDIATKGRHGSLGQQLVPCIGLGHLSRTLAVTGACRGLSGSLRCVLGSADAGLLHARAPLQHWHWDSPGWHCPSPLSFQLRWRSESACLCRSPPPPFTSSLYRAAQLSHFEGRRSPRRLFLLHHHPLCPSSL